MLKKKSKLTLSVDSEVVRKARGLGINISEITEGILRGFSFTPSRVEIDVLYEKYEQLFEAMKPLQKRYEVSVKVGDYPIEKENGELLALGKILLLTDGSFWIDEIDVKVRNINEIIVNYFDLPKEILSNFIEALSHSDESRKQQLTELEMAKRIIEAITNTTGQKKISKLTKSKHIRKKE